MSDITKLQKGYLPFEVIATVKESVETLKMFWKKTRM